ncbi:hypothetical protein BJX61DRAFT_517838 [Aspergillus egyptiacus]|nr:hypothetical protein BJX61DRAFT_517838 [Aspergillus egyptiacus]
MPAKHHPPQQTQTSKQDPTERRRLQNRLSQRNHRRKIRDRIAKLQERVIASELRAAASLHNWHSAPCIPYEVKPSPSSTSSSSLSLSPSASTSACSSSSSPPTELAAPACSSYNISLNPLTPLGVLPSGYEDGCAGVGSLAGGSGTSSPGSGTGLAVSEGVGLGAGASFLGQGSGFGLDTMQICEQWGFQGSVYLATESSLPQILQTLGPTSNAVIIVAPGYVLASEHTGCSASPLEYASGQCHGHGQSQSPGLENGNATCQCQSLGWMNCPVHPLG